MKTTESKEEMCCGCCCWFYAEDAYGYGCCPFQFAEIKKCDEPCNIKDKFVSKEMMRHHLAVMLSYLRNKQQGLYNDEAKWPDELDEPLKFAYKYIKTFSNL